MLVQLSNFKTVNTSVKVPSPSRRRKRNDSDTCDLLPVAASFINTSSTRGQAKWKQHSAEFSDLRPLLLVSSDHQVSAIGRSKEYTYDEFSSLQYTSRPGSVGSFAPPLNGDKSSDLPRIPPILDAKNEYVYALQHGNTRLCCWHPLKSNGPDEKHSVRVDLAKPAVSMSLLPLQRGIIYGSCIDGSLFIARLESSADGGTEILSIEYLPSMLQQGERHAGTTAELPDGYLKGHGRKRKMSDADGRTNVNFYQVFYDAASLQLVRREVQFERFATNTAMFAMDTVQQRVARIPLVSGNDESLVSAQLHVTTSGPVPKTSVMYRVKTKRQATSDLCYVLMLSLTSGNLAHNKVALPPEARQCGMISETLLVVTDQKSLFLYDLETASLIHTMTVPKDVQQVAYRWLLCTDSKFGTLALLHEVDGALKCNISSLMLDERYDNVPSVKLSLSSKLASAVLDADAAGTCGATLVVKDLGKLQPMNDPSPGVASMDELVAEMLQSLEVARIKTITPGEKDVRHYLFMDTYDGSVVTILTALDESISKASDSKEHRNPQDDLHLNSHGRINGIKQISKKAPKNVLNGVHSPPTPRIRAYTPAMLPQAFLDGATQIVLKLLQSGPVEDRDLSKRIALARLDARVILSRLLNTGKLSARHHFDGTENIQSSSREHSLTSALRSVKLSNKRGRRYFSPVDMIVTMLQKCPDVSERQMVVMLSYMMRRALPDDIANVFYEERKSFLSNQYTVLTRKYFAEQTRLAKAAGPSNRGPLESPELEKLGHQLILAGTSYVLYRIVCYSQCNEAMLRVALQDSIETPEAIILARLLSEMLASTKSKDFISKRPPSANAIQSICQWVAALSDSFHEELSTKSGEDGKSHMATLLDSIKLTTKHSQEIISLKEDLRRVDYQIQSQLEAKNAPLATRAQPYQEDLPGYAVENLIF